MLYITVTWEEIKVKQAVIKLVDEDEAYDLTATELHDISHPKILDVRHTVIDSEERDQRFDGARRQA